MKRTLVSSAAILVLMGLGAASAQAWPLPSWLHHDDATTVAQSSPSAPAAAVPAAPIAPLASVSMPNYRAIVQAYGPAVVGVTVSGTRNVSAQDGPAMQDDPFFRFFQGVPGFHMPQQGQVPFRGQGSGFILSADGLILTNAHVVRDAKEVTVKLKDRREFKAKVLGSDPATDVAVIKIDAHNLTTVALGDSKAVQVGDYVLAIGAPYGFEQTATQGIVSAKGRSLPGDSYVPFIQTDAAVNPGNSGGPLFDATGRVIGINAQIYSQSGGFQGLAFAIPVDVALHVKDQIVAQGHVDHARLGVTLQDLSAPLAESFGMKSPDGALVSNVAPKTAAARADLQPGDVITAIDGQPVHTAGDVSTRVGLAAPGDKLTLTVWRDKTHRDLKVALGKADAEDTTKVAQAQGGSLGLTVRPLTGDEKQQAGVDHGLVVENAVGPAAQAGIEAGDVVLALNGRPVESVSQMQGVLRSHPGHVALLIARNGEQIFVPVDLG
jgi:serine protease Do